MRGSPSGPAHSAAQDKGRYSKPQFPSSSSENNGGMIVVRIKRDGAETRTVPGTGPVISVNRTRRLSQSLPSRTYRSLRKE